MTGFRCTAVQDLCTPHRYLRARPHRRAVNRAARVSGRARRRRELRRGCRPYPQLAPNRPADSVGIAVLAGPAGAFWASDRPALLQGGYRRNHDQDRRGTACRTGARLFALR